jgi:hypothetical protein
MHGKLVQLTLFLLAAAPAFAQTLMVESVVSPAWVERGGSRLPLAVGVRLADKDQIRTGPGGRALLRMAEGSAVRLGENATLGVDGLAERRSAGARLVTASLDVVRGAFRFTTDIFAKKKSARDVKIRVTTITAGIRGTDVWGKSQDDRDIVCLIEGRIGVEHGGSQFTMSDPRSFFIAPRKEKPLPVAPVDAKQLAEWSAETDIARGAGGARRGGRHHITVAVAADQQSALATYDKLRGAGYPAVVLAAKKDGGEEYRIGVRNLPTRQDAAAMAAKLKALGFADAAAR